MLTLLLGKASISNSVGGPGRHEDQVKDSQASAQIVKWESYPTQGHSGALIYNIGKMEGQRAIEAGRPTSYGPAGLRVQASKLSEHRTVTRRQSETSRRRWWPDGHSPRPAGLGWPAGPTMQPLRSRLLVEVKHNCHSCVPPALTEIPARNRPWSAINRTLSITCKHTPKEQLSLLISRVGLVVGS
jgi:hypothetical protein